MKSKLYYLFGLLALLSANLSAQQADSHEYLVEFKTNKGSFVIKLYNETPKHRDNFLKLVRSNSYDNLIFHRVIKGFMIQAGGNILNGDETSADNLETQHSETLAPEFMFPTKFHKQGAVAAARLSDEENPEKRSSPLQFYIVTGKFFLDHELEKMFRKKELNLPPKVKEAYMSQGGAPHLDNEYTVFGEIVKGYKVVDKIQNIPTDDNDAPTKPIYIKSAKILSQ